jgi:hypothetical protein
LEEERKDDKYMTRRRQIKRNRERSGEKVKERGGGGKRKEF